MTDQTNNRSKKNKVIFWIATILIFIFEGIMPAVTGHTEMAVEGIRALGYPDYFRVMLTVAKVLGALALILPMVPHRVKEWAYAGFTFTFIAAFVSNWAVNGFNIGMLSIPIIAGIILGISYKYYHKLRA